MDGLCLLHFRDELTIYNGTISRVLISASLVEIHIKYENWLNISPRDTPSFKGLPCHRSVTLH